MSVVKQLYYVTAFVQNTSRWLLATLELIAAIVVHSEPFIKIIGILLLIVRFVKTWDQTIIQIIKKNKSILMSLTRKTTSFKSLRVDNWEITQVKSKYQINFSVKLAKKGVTQKKWISSSNFIFKIVQPSNFNLNWQSLNFWTKLSQKEFPVWKRNKWKLPSNTSYSNKSRF